MTVIADVGIGKPFDCFWLFFDIVSTLNDNDNKFENLVSASLLTFYFKWFSWNKLFLNYSMDHDPFPIFEI